MKQLYKFTHTLSNNFFATASQNYTQSTALDAPPLDSKFQISKTYKQFIKASIWVGGILTLLLLVSGEMLGQTSLNAALVVNALAERSIESVEADRLSEPATCFNITNGGAIGSNQTIAPGGTPTTLTNITTPSGGSGTIEYLWLRSTTLPCPPIGDAAWQSIASSNTATYSPGPLTQSTCFLRCSRRSGCTEYDGEANAVTITVNTCPSITGLNFDNQVGGSNITFTNGGTFTTAQLGSDFLLEAVLTGTAGSVVFNVTGAATFTTTENSAPYHMAGSGSAWTPVVGTYNVVVRVYSGSNGSGTLCTQQTFTFTVINNTCSCPNNIIQNPSYENGTTNWSWTGGNFAAGTYAAVCGANSGQFQITNGGNNWVSQTIAGGSLPVIAPGTTLNITVRAGTHNPSGYYHEVNVNFYNSSWGFISKTSAEVNVTLPSTGTYTLNSVVPAGTHYITVGGTGTGDWIKFDQWCLSLPCSINISTQPQGVSICSGGTHTLTAAATATSGTVSYQWQSSPNGSTWTNISGATSASYTTSALTTTTHYRVNVSSSGVGCPTISSNAAIVTVTADPIISIISTKSDFCVGEGATLNSTISGGLNCAAVQWQYRMGTSGTWNNLATGNSISTGTSLAVGTHQYRALYTCSGAGCDAATSNTISIIVTANASVSIAANSPNVCVGSSTTLTATPSGGGTCSAVQWQYRPGISGTWINLTTGNSLNTSTSLVVGTYQYRALYNCSAAGCGDAISNTVTINIRPNPTANAGADASVCDGSSVTLTASGSGGTSPYTFAWSNGLGSGASKTVSPVVNTTYTVTATDSYGCSSTDQVVVSVNEPPLALITCEDDPLIARSITSTTSSCSPSPYAFWTDGAIFSPSCTNENYWTAESGAIFEEYGNGKAYLNMTVRNACQTNWLLKIEVVFSGRTFTPPAGSPKEEGCLGDQSNSDWYYYTTTKGVITGLGNLVGLEGSITNMGPAFQLGTGANLREGTKFGGSGWMNFVFTSPPTNTSITIINGQTDFNFNLSGSALNTTTATSTCLQICAGESVTLTGEGLGPNTPFSYQWSNGATTSSITVSPNITTIYIVTVTDANNCSATDQVTVTVTPGATVNAGPDQTICLGNTVTMAGSIGGAATSATWTSSVAGGSFAPGTTTLNAVYTPPSGYTGNITMTLTTNDPAGACPPAIDQMIITINPPATVNA
ncbi:MAG: hypothetical protein SH848_13325, partial [Saprospiraceae bacterium]|nr:hypothetical protein [Saprospiraceae bacterium]